MQLEINNDGTTNTFDLDGRWHEVGRPDFDEENPTQRTPLMFSPIRESNGDDQSLAAMSGHYLDAVMHALEHGIRHVIFSEAVIPATGNRIPLHDEMFERIEFADRKAYIFVRGTDRISRSVEYGKWFWKKAREIDAEIHTKDSSFPFSADGRRRWSKEIDINVKNNLRRSRGNAESHRRSRDNGTWRHKIPHCFAPDGTGRLVIRDTHRQILHDIYTDGKGLHKPLSRIAADLGNDHRLSGPKRNRTQKEREATIKKVFGDPIYAGLRAVRDADEGYFDRVNCEALITPEDYGWMSLRYLNHNQSKLGLDREFLLANRVNYGQDRRKLSLTSGLVVVEGEVLFEEKAYFHLDAHGGRCIHPIDEMHSQLSSIWSAIAGTKHYLPDDLLTLWEQTPVEEQRDFVKKYIPQTLGMDGCRLTPPKRA